MPFTLTMPKLSPTMEEGTIVKWRVKEGDHVKSGDVLIEVATDKATVEHEALDAGYLRKILVPEGGSAVVNQALAIFTESQDESIEGYKPEGVAKEKPPGPSAIEEEKEIPVATTPTKKAAGPGLSQPSFVPLPPLESYRFERPTGEVKASPLAKRLAKEKGINLSTIKGTGPGGRIVEHDLDKGQPLGPVSFGLPEKPSIAPGSYEEIPLSQMRKVIGKRLQESKTFIPHFYVTQEVDADPMINIRTQLKEMGLKVTFNDFILRAAALSLREHPTINSGYNSENETIISFKTIDISFAVSFEGGLITPIIRHADYKNLGELSVEAKSLGRKAKTGKLAPEEFQGGSFTISNLGMYGITNFAAIINPPQAAILSVGGIIEKPVVKSGQIVPGNTMSFTLCSDHRVIDGTDAAAFLVTLKKFLENPSSLLV